MCAMQVGGFSTAGILKLAGFLKQPLELKPGTGYSYVNANFMIAGYIVEKVSICFLDRSPSDWIYPQDQLLWGCSGPMSYGAAVCIWS
jgi:hypothetical protein